MLYLERRPHPALVPFVKTLWYACDPQATHRHERILPSGHAQIVISLARGEDLTLEDPPEEAAISAVTLCGLHHGVLVATDEQRPAQAGDTGKQSETARGKGARLRSGSDALWH